MKRSHGWIDPTSGALAGALAKTLTAPLERIKLVLQNQELAIGRAAAIPVKGLVDGFRQISKERLGYRTFWRGNGVNMLRVLPTYGIRFYLYPHFYHFSSRHIAQTDISRLCAGGLAGAGAVLFTHPLDTVRTRLAAARSFSDERAYRGFMDCFLSTWRDAGARGFYVGCMVSLMEIAPYTAITFAGYEGAKHRLAAQGAEVSGLWKLSFGLASGALATSCCYPLDTVRRQLMLEGARGFAPKYQRNLLRCLSMLWIEGGVRRFYRGWSVTMVKAVPTVALTFCANDFFRETLHSKFG